MNIKIKKVHPNAVIPKYAHEGDVGFDLVAVEDVVIEPGETALIKTGIALELPQGYELQVRPRSGITLRTKLRVQLGTIDSNYRGEIGVIVDNISIVKPGWAKWVLDAKGEKIRTIGSYLLGTHKISKGDRIAQAVIAPVVQATFEEVDELSDSERGQNGFGSSGVTA